jgi:hypothetical protein
VHDQRRVVKVAGRTPFKKGYRGLEDLSVQSYRVSTGPEREPIQVNPRLRLLGHVRASIGGFRFKLKAMVTIRS